MLNLALAGLLLFGAACNAKSLTVPSRYTCKARFWVPSPDNVQNMRIAFDEKTTRERVEFYNATGSLIDYTIINGEKQCSIETHNHDLACVKIAPPAAGRPQDLQYLLPDATEAWEQMEDTRLDGRTVHHYRLVGRYEALDEHNTSNDVKETQQEYYCYTSGSICVPVRWEIWGISMFGSHYDHYILDYSEFSTTVVESDFKQPSLCDGVPEPEPNPGPDPGPTVGVASRLSSIANGRARNSRLFLEFARENGRNYTPEEIATRAQIFQKRRALIAKHNANADRSFTMTMNRFGDMTTQEAIRAVTGFRPSSKAQARSANIPTWSYQGSTDALPKNIDWRVRAGSIKAKDQVACGSCWTFGAIGTIEPRINLLRFKQGLLDQPYVRFSEQALVDCFWGQGSFGCSGGDTFDVIDWLVKEKGGRLAFEDEYPYLGQNDYCKDELFNKHPEYRVTGVKLVEPYSIASLKASLVEGPVSVTIGVTESFLFYSSGIYFDRSCPGQNYNDLSHAVVAMGYGVDEKYGEYLIVRNSWSEYWGMDGYIYIALNADNICGILTYPGFAEVSFAK